MMTNYINHVRKSYKETRSPSKYGQDQEDTDFSRALLSHINSNQPLPEMGSEAFQNLSHTTLVQDDFDIAAWDQTSAAEQNVTGGGSHLAQTVENERARDIALPDAPNDAGSDVTVTPLEESLIGTTQVASATAKPKAKPKPRKRAPAKKKTPKSAAAQPEVQMPEGTLQAVSEASTAVAIPPTTTQQSDETPTHAAASTVTLPEEGSKSNQGTQREKLKKALTRKTAVKTMTSQPLITRITKKNNPYLLPRHVCPSKAPFSYLSDKRQAVDLDFMKYVTFQPFFRFHRDAVYYLKELKEKKRASAPTQPPAQTPEVAELSMDQFESILSKKTGGRQKKSTATESVALHRPNFPTGTLGTNISVNIRSSTTKVDAPRRAERPMTHMQERPVSDLNLNAVEQALLLQERKKQKVGESPKSERVSGLVSVHPHHAEDSLQVEMSNNPLKRQSSPQKEFDIPESPFKQRRLDTLASPLPQPAQQLSHQETEINNTPWKRWDEKSAKYDPRASTHQNSPAQYASSTLPDQSRQYDESSFQYNVTSSQPQYTDQRMQARQHGGSPLYYNSPFPPTPQAPPTPDYHLRQTNSFIQAPSSTSMSSDMINIFDAGFVSRDVESFDQALHMRQSPSRRLSQSPRADPFHFESGTQDYGRNSYDEQYPASFEYPAPVQRRY